MKQGFVAVKLQSSLRKLYITWLTVIEYPRICDICRNNNPVLSLFITYHWVCNESNICHIFSRNCLPFRRPYGLVLLGLYFSLVFCTSLFVIWSFFFFLLSVIRFPVSDYPSGLFKLFWHSLGWSDWDTNPWSMPYSLHHRCGHILDVIF